MDTRVRLAGQGGLLVRHIQWKWACKNGAKVQKVGLGKQKTYADSVDDTETEGTAFKTVAHGEDGIGGFSGLRDKDGDVVTEHGCSAV